MPKFQVYFGNIFLRKDRLMKKRRYIFFIGIVVLAALMVYGCSGEKREKEESKMSTREKIRWDMDICIKICQIPIFPILLKR